MTDSLPSQTIPPAATSSGTRVAPIDIERRVQVTPDEAYFAFTNSSMLELWLCDHATLHPHVGASYLMVWNGYDYHAAGAITELEPGARLGFTWQGRGEPGETRVEVTFTADGDATIVRLTHGGFAEGNGWTTIAERLRGAWARDLDGLRAVLERGENWRLMRRPMVGVNLETLSPEKAVSLNIAPDAGILLIGVLEDGAAVKAGLKTNDVIGTIGGVPTRSYAEFTGVLGHHAAGDTVPVTYWRDGEQQTAAITLGKRAPIEVPGTPQAIAARMRENVAVLFAELDEILGAHDDAALTYEPIDAVGQSDWSVVETLAHLIFAERWTQIYTWLAVHGDAALRWPGNDRTQRAGILANFPSPRAMIDAYKREVEATIAVAEALPESFVHHKARYGEAARLLLDMFGHTREHFDQMRATLAAAPASGVVDVPAS